MDIKYKDYLINKSQIGGGYGFDPIWMCDKLFDFQKHLVEWSLRKGRAAIFADCGMGKTLMQLVWAENIARKTNGRVLILTPLAVAAQTCREAETFGIDCTQTRDGSLPTAAKVITCNYQRLHMLDHKDFEGVVCDESSILKNCDGATRQAVTEFMKKVKYRLLCTATAAPNDYVELGTSSEALGYLGHMDMLSKFFKNDQNSNHPNRQWTGGKWRFRGHAQETFWRWVCSWARAARKPSDLGFADGQFLLPNLHIKEHLIEARSRPEGWLFDVPAEGLVEQRQEQRRTIQERCEKVAEITCSHDTPSVAWCHLNEEGDIITKLIPGAVQVSGKDSDDKKEEIFGSFQKGEIRALVTKPKIAGFGLNWQHCHRQTFFPSNSYEQWYQAIRRCWRFGQKKDVTIDVICTEGSMKVMDNQKGKAAAADEMFGNIVALMKDELSINRTQNYNTKTRIPQWL